MESATYNARGWLEKYNILVFFFAESIVYGVHTVHSLFFCPTFRDYILLLLLITL